MEGCASVLLVLFSILSPSPAGGFVLQMYQACGTDSGPQGLGFYYTVIFNKMVIAQYSPQDQLFIPCPYECIPDAKPYVIQITTYLNVNCSASQWMGQAAKTCISNGQRFWGDTAQRTSQPIVKIAHIDPVNTQDPVMLACYVYDFYPKPINVTWLKNGHPITSNVTGSTMRPNGDWSYQTQVNLELTPRPGDVYSCRVQHRSLGEPIVEEWNPGLTMVQQIKISISVVVLAIGLIFFVAGLISWMRSRPEGYVPIPGGSYPQVS